MTYTLTATYDGWDHNHTIEAEDDTDATFAAMAWVLDSAVKNGWVGEAWAMGEIKLTDKTGVVIRTMPAKETA